jgi:hypothetical protein
MSDVPIFYLIKCQNIHGEIVDVGPSSRHIINLFFFELDPTSSIFFFEGWEKSQIIKKEKTS